MPHLPRKVKVDVSRCHQVPRLPRKVKVAVAKCHACHAKWRSMSPANSRGDQRTQARHQSQPSAISATPATQNARRCRQAPRLPRKQPRRPKEPARHQSQPSAKSATPATQNARRCRQVPRLPRKQPRRPKDPSAPPEPAQCHKCHACHAECTSMSPSARPATETAAATTSYVLTSCVRVSCVWTNCVWASCVWASWVWVSCVWASCVWVSCVWASCVWVSCVWTSWVWASWVWASWVWASCVCEQVVCEQVVCVWISCVCVWTICVWTSCVWTSCVCVSKLCVNKLRVDKLSVSKLCVSKLCVIKLWVSEGGDWRRQAGVHNQKQEPHTKMWGKRIAAHSRAIVPNSICTWWFPHGFFVALSRKLNWHNWIAQTLVPSVLLAKHLADKRWKHQTAPSSRPVLLPAGQSGLCSRCQHNVQLKRQLLLSPNSGCDNWDNRLNSSWSSPLWPSVHITLCQFTGSGWGLWFSTRKWMLYKLGTQENLATYIKPIWGTLEKWQPPRSAFSKLWIVFFLRKTSPCLNCIMLKFRNQNFWKQLPGNGSIFLEPNIQPIEFFELFEFHRNSIPLTSQKITLLRNLLRNPVEPDLAKSPSFSGTFSGTLLTQSLPDLPDLLRNLRNRNFLWEPCWTWPGSCTSAHRSYSGLKTPISLRYCGKMKSIFSHIQPISAWSRKTPRLPSHCGGTVFKTHLPTPLDDVGMEWHGWEPGIFNTHI